jgi:chorismate mutase/prephenate dehydratase
MVRNTCASRSATLDCGSVDEIFHEVEKGNANYGVVPIENSSNGVIGATVDMLFNVFSNTL